MRMRRSCFESATFRFPFLSGTIRISSPFKKILPAFGCSRKLMQRRKVLFPEPLEPMMLITEPPFACRETPLSTSLFPYLLCRSSTTSVPSRIEKNHHAKVAVVGTVEIDGLGPG